MFTGIIEDIGTVKAINKIESGIQICIQTKLADEIKEGDSIATNGACLTATRVQPPLFCVDVSFETLNRTNLKNLTISDKVNLERALKVDGRIDGHLVLGHVDTTAIVESIARIGDFYILRLKIDRYTFDHSVEKGSICVDGISLTIADLKEETLDIAVIPFTFENTTLKFRKSGDCVNIEVDIIGKYVEKFLSRTNKSRIDENFLKEHGFI